MIGREGLWLVKEVPLADRMRDVGSEWQIVKLWHHLVQGFSKRLILEMWYCPNFLLLRLDNLKTKTNEV